MRFTSSMRFCEAVSLSSPVANICFFGFLLQVKSTGTDPLCNQLDLFLGSKKEEETGSQMANAMRAIYFVIVSKCIAI